MIALSRINLKNSCDDAQLKVSNSQLFKIGVRPNRFYMNGTQ